MVFRANRFLIPAFQRILAGLFLIGLCFAGSACRVSKTECAALDGLCNPLFTHLMFTHRNDGSFECSSLATSSWSTFAGSGLNDLSGEIIQTSDCGFLTVGQAGSGFAISGGLTTHNASGGQMAVVKYDYQGNVEWHTYIGGSGTDLAENVVQAADGGYLILGSSTATFGSPLLPFVAGFTNMTLVKLNAAGAQDWHLFLGDATGNMNLGGILRNGGNILVTGGSQATIQNIGAPLNAHTGGAVYNLLLANFDANGSVQWHTFAGNGTQPVVATEIALTSDGGYALVGSGAQDFGTTTIIAYQGAGADNDMFVSKFDASGGHSWNSYFGTNGGVETGAGISQNSTGEIIACGSAPAAPLVGTYGTPSQAFQGLNDFMIVRLNNAGALQDYFFLGEGAGNQHARILQGTADGGLVVSGYSDMTIGGARNAYAGGNDFLTYKLDASTAVEWFTFHGSAGGSEIAAGLIESAEGGVLISGVAAATFGTPIDAYQGAVDIGVVRLDTSGD